MGRTNHLANASSRGVAGAMKKTTGVMFLTQILGRRKEESTRVRYSEGQFGILARRCITHQNCSR